MVRGKWVLSLGASQVPRFSGNGDGTLSPSDIRLVSVPSNVMVILVDPPRTRRLRATQLNYNCEYGTLLATRNRQPVCSRIPWRLPQPKM